VRSSNSFANLKGTLQVKAIRFGRAAAVLSIAALALTACGSDNPTASQGGAGTTPAGSGVSGTLSGAGASSQDSAMQAWMAGFTALNSGATVQYSPDGSGAGRDAFLAGGVQFAGSDAHLDDEEFAKAKEICGPGGAMDIPAYVSPIAIAFNLEGVKDINMDAETIAKVFRGEITQWNDEAIASQNEGAELPGTAITVVHRSDESGTTENFVEYLSAAAPKVWTDEVSGDWPAKLGGENAQGTSGVVSTTTSTNGAITYADASAIGELGTVKVKVGDEYVAYSPEAAAKAVEVAGKVAGRGDLDMSLELKRDTTESGAYPVVLVSYHIYCSSYKDQATADLVKAFGNYVISEEGQKDAQESAGNAPISETLREQAKTAIDSIKVAS
jgi:phosphate transport system substrate-binding protein